MFANIHRASHSAQDVGDLAGREPEGSRSVQVRLASGIDQTFLPIDFAGYQPGALWSLSHSSPFSLSSFNMQSYRSELKNLDKQLQKEYTLRLETALTEQREAFEAEKEEALQSLRQSFENKVWVWFGFELIFPTIYIYIQSSDIFSCGMIRHLFVTIAITIEILSLPLSLTSRIRSLRRSRRQRRSARRLRSCRSA